MTKHISVLPGGLNDKQQLFCREYLIDLDGTKAAIRAGYSPRTAAQQATRLLKHPIAGKVIQAEMDKRAERTVLDADWVLGNLKEVVQRCLQQKPVLDRKGTPTGEWTFDSAGVNRALELVGRHLKLFTDKVEVRGEVEGLAAIAKRIADKIKAEEKEAAISTAAQRRGKNALCKP